MGTKKAFRPRGRERMLPKREKSGMRDALTVPMQKHKTAQELGFQPKKNPPIGAGC